MNSLMRLMFPWMLCFADGGGAASGSQDGGASGAAKTPSEPAAGDKSGDAETIMVSKKDYERLTGRIGQLEDGERRRTDEKKKADDEEAKKRGEHEKLLQERDAELAAVKPYQERYTTRVKTDHERRIKLVDQCDDKVKAQFKKAGDGKELSLADMEANLAKLDEYEALGLLTPKAGGDGNTVVVPAAGQQHVTTKADNSPRTFDPWKS